MPIFKSNIKIAKITSILQSSLKLHIEENETCKRGKISWKGKVKNFIVISSTLKSVMKIRVTTFHRMHLKSLKSHVSIRPYTTTFCFSLHLSHD